MILKLMMIVYILRYVACFKHLNLIKLAQEIFPQNLHTQSKLKFQWVTRNVYFVLFNNDKNGALFKWNLDDKKMEVMEILDDIQSVTPFSINGTNDRGYIINNVSLTRMNVYIPKKKKYVVHIIIGNDGNSVEISGDVEIVATDLKASTIRGNAFSSIALYNSRKLYIVDVLKNTMVNVNLNNLKGDIVSIVWVDGKNFGFFFNLNEHVAYIRDSKNSLYRYVAEKETIEHVDNNIMNLYTKDKYIFLVNLDGKKMVSADQGNIFTCMHIIGGSHLNNVSHLPSSIIKNHESVYHTNKFSIKNIFSIRNRVLLFMHETDASSGKVNSDLFISDIHGYVYQPTKFINILKDVDNEIQFWCTSKDEFVFPILTIHSSSFISFNSGDSWKNIQVDGKNIHVVHVDDYLQKLGFIGIRESPQNGLSHYYITFDGCKSWKMPVSDLSMDTKFFPISRYQMIIIHCKSILYISLSAGLSWYTIDISAHQEIFQSLSTSDNDLSQHNMNKYMYARHNHLIQNVEFVVFDINSVTMTEFIIKIEISECKIEEKSIPNHCDSGELYIYSDKEISGSLDNFCYVSLYKRVFEKNNNCLCDENDFICSIGYLRDEETNKCLPNEDFNSINVGYTCINNKITRITSIGYEPYASDLHYPHMCNTEKIQSLLKYSISDTGDNCTDSKFNDVIETYITSFHPVVIKVHRIVYTVSFVFSIILLLFILQYGYFHRKKRKYRISYLTSDAKVEQISLINNDESTDLSDYSLPDEN